MGKHFITLSILFLISFSYAHAGHNENVRKKCRWWAKKYRAECHIGGPGVFGGIFNLFGWETATDGDCTSAYAHLADPGACGQTISATSQANSSGAGGSVSIPCSLNWGGIPSDLFGDINNGIDSIGVDEIGAQETQFIPVFDENLITLQNIAIHLESQANSSRVNSFTITVWLPEDDSVNLIEDTIITSTKTISYGTVSLIEGKIQILGSLFSANDFTLSTVGNTTVVDYVGGTKIIDVSSIDTSRDIAINGAGDIKQDEVSLYAKKSISLAGNPENEVVLYPNPLSNKCSLTILGSESNVVEARFYDLSGKLLFTKKNIHIEQGKRKQIDINTAELLPGQYFVLIQGKDLKVLKSFNKLQ
ncbi:MAG: T9SS type A sorting domain-containing protein [Edaphocola sp.]